MNIYNLTLEQLETYFINKGDKKFRAKQIYEWLHVKLVSDFDMMTNLSKDVAKSFILYRENRTRERNKQSPLTRQVKRHIMADNVKNQNANVDENSFGGRRGEASGAVMKDYALNYCMSKKAVP